MMQGKGILLDHTENWECPSCGLQHVTTNAGTQIPLHQCPTHALAWVPLVRAGVKAHHRINERQDYLGTDSAETGTDAEGRIIQSVTTEREEGEDTHIFATTFYEDRRQS